MRVMVTTGGGSSIFYPFVPLAWAFRAAGHEVRLVGKPQSTEILVDTGLPVVTLGGPPKLPPGGWDELVGAAYGDARAWPRAWPARPAVLDAEQRGVLEAFGRYTIAVAEGMADDLITFAAQWRPDLIVYETLSLSVMAVPGVTCVRYTHGTQDVLRLECDVDGEPLPDYVRLLGRFEARPPVGPLHYVDTMPPSMYVGGERPCVPMRWVPYNGAGAVPDGLSGPRGRPRVCVTWGVSMSRAFGSAAADPYRDAIEHLSRSDVDVLVLAGTEELPTLDTPADRVRRIAGAPLSLVLPYCDAIIHHGGDGTAMAAAALAVPQLIITREPIDAIHNGQLAATGAGIHFRAQDLERDSGGPARIRDAIDKLLSDPGYADGAARLREDIERQPTPAEVVSQLAALP